MPMGMACNLDARIIHSLYLCMKRRIAYSFFFFFSAVLLGSESDIGLLLETIISG